MTTVPLWTTSDTCRGACCAARSDAKSEEDGDEAGAHARNSIEEWPEDYCAVPFHLVDHPLVHDALAELRDVRTPPPAFRAAAHRSA